MKRWMCLCLLVLLTSAARSKSEYELSKPVSYSGTCDASAAVPLDDNAFAVASDEDNVIRIYRRDQVGAPVQSIDLNSFLDVDPKHPEVDLEAAARIGNRIYWMGSESRNRRGKVRESRHRFFAMELTSTNWPYRLRTVGVPYAHLLDDLIGDARLSRFKLAAAASLAPKTAGALNIEGLCATPEGYLFIGFRSPVPKGKALIVPLINPSEVIQGRPARFADPILLDLGGRGIRDMVFRDGHYFIIAGNHGAKASDAEIYRWAGIGKDPKMLKGLDFKGLNPEAILSYPGKHSHGFQLLSDDGKKVIGGTECKSLDPADRRFRSVWITPMKTE